MPCPWRHPGTQTTPFRFSPDRKTARYRCDHCFKGTFRRAEGTWLHGTICLYLAQNRLQAHADGLDCAWVRGQCWVQEVEKQGCQVPSGEAIHEQMQ
eukprot:3036498-Pyramimonas_sp.AAC.1